MSGDNLFVFLASVVVISLSGVVAPGPLLAVTLAKGPQSPHAGAAIGIGHGIVEFPLIALIALGFGTVFSSPVFTVGVGLLGGSMLLYLGVGIVRARGALRGTAKDLPHRSLVAGAVATLVNPYFFLWWATIGAALVLQARGWGWMGLVLFGIVHWSCDLGWYWLISALLARGKGGGTLPRVLYLVSGVLLAGFGAWFLAGAIRELSRLRS